MRTKSIAVIVAGTGLILSIPLIAMRFTEEVQWGLFDFIIIGTLLIGAGMLYEYIAVRISPNRRLIIALVITLAVLLIWAELAVGVVGTPFAGS
jgi:hypothetical protein